MKTMKKLIAIILTVLILTATAAYTVLPVSAAGICEFIGDDWDTRGDWVGKYGEDGYFILANEISDHIPAYATVDTFNGSKDGAPWIHVWYDDSDGNRVDSNGIEIEEGSSDWLGALYVDKEKSSRAAACYGDGTSLYIVVDVGDNSKYVSIYSICWKYNARTMEINVYDENDNLLVDALPLGQFSNGAYLTFKISGKVTFEYKHIGGGNSVYSGIFFDSVEESPVIETEEPTEPDVPTEPSVPPTEPEKPETLAPTEPEKPDEPDVTKPNITTPTAPQVGDADTIILTAFMTLSIIAGVVLFKRKNAIK